MLAYGLRYLGLGQANLREELLANKYLDLHTLALVLQKKAVGNGPEYSRTGEIFECRHL